MTSSADAPRVTFLPDGRIFVWPPGCDDTPGFPGPVSPLSVIGHDAYTWECYKASAAYGYRWWDGAIRFPPP